MITYLNAEELQGRDITVPFELNLKDSPHNIIVNTILRILPNRRITALATWKGEPVVVKIFMEEKYFQRDRQGVLAMDLAQVPTPKLLFKDCDRSETLFLLVFEYIKDAVSLKESRIDPQVLSILARLHEHGLVHDDLHLDNFLVKDGHVYLLDGDGVRQLNPNGSLNQKASFKNLAQYFCQFSAAEDHQINIDNYLLKRDWKTSKNFCHYVEKARKKRLKKFRLKTLRSCTAFEANKSLTQRQVLSRGYAMPSLDFSQDTIIKDGNTCTVAEVESNNQHWIIKRYNIKSMLHGLSRAFRRTRARRSWTFSHLLQLLGIRTAKPVALIEKRWGPIKRKAYFVAEKIQGLTLDKQICSKSNEQTNVINSTIDLLYQLYANKISHGDLKASNFIVEEGETYIIDLDSAKLHESNRTLNVAWQKDISRFLRNWDELPEIKQSFTHGLKLRGLLL